MTRLPKVLYISGPMTGLPEYNYPAFHAAEEALVAAGYAVVNPARRPADPAISHEEYLARDLRDIETMNEMFSGQCGVVLLPGWAKSKGASMEIYRACEYGWVMAGAPTWITRAKEGAAG